MEEDMIMNVPAAPDMQGTPMPPDLSGQMQPEMSEVSQAEMQEAQGALMQIVEVINMLVQQGLNEDQIMEFLAQYGITEDELDQAAEVLGVDIDALLGGQMQQPQEPMMMAGGGAGVLPNKDQMMAANMMRSSARLQEQLPPQQTMVLSDNEPMMQDRSIENQIFSLETQRNNLMNDYNIAVNDQDFDTAQAIANQLNNIDVAISQMQAQMPMGLGEKKN